MMKFIRHLGSTTQYNTMQSNVKKQKKEKKKKRLWLYASAATQKKRYCSKMLLH